MQMTLEVTGLDDIVQALRAEGRTVIAPVVEGDVIAHRPIEHADELPIGVSDRLEPGAYRLERTGRRQRFGFSSPSESWKQFLHPPRSLLIRARRTADGIAISEPELEVSPMAFFGVRSCDLVAIDILDRVFLAPDATDEAYKQRRRDVFIVAAACSHPGSTCFCASMDTGPSPKTGFDLAISEIDAADPSESPRYVVSSGTARGEALLDRLAGAATTAADRDAVQAVHSSAVASMTRTVDTDGVAAATIDPDDPRWDDVAQRCLACGNCTLVCPTCFCSSTEDTTNLSGTTADRWRVWDTCFSLDFSHLGDGPVRSTTKQRYRQWLLHKFVTWQDQFGSSGCVGCGRCVVWCPVGIDVTVELAALVNAPVDAAVGR